MGDFGVGVVCVPYEQRTLGTPDPFRSGVLPTDAKMKDAIGRPVDVLALDETLSVR